MWAPLFTGFGGGIGSFSRAIARSVKELGHDVRLFGKLDVDSDFEGLRLTGGGGARLMRTARFAARCVAAGTRQRPDLIISTHLNFGPAASFASRVSGSRYALVAHGIDVHPQLSRFAVAALREADQIVAVSDWTRRRTIALGGIDAGRVAILPNTFDEVRFTPGPGSAALMSRYAIAPGEKVILTVARLESHEGYKGYDRLVEAMPEIRAACGIVRLLVVGGGSDRSRLMKMAHSIGVSDSVTLAGFVPDAELADHYRLADVFAMPSTGEGFGIVFLEAMACGIPVLGGNRDGSVEALADGALGKLVDPLDTSAIAAGLISLLGREGKPEWFNPVVLRDSVVKRFGGKMFRSNLERLLSPLSAGAS